MGEYISREAFLNYLRDRQAAERPWLESEADTIIGVFERQRNIGAFDCLDETITQIENMPAADVRPVVRGKWISQPYARCECSNCGFYEIDVEHNFCPNCGADMGSLPELPKEEKE